MSAFHPKWTLDISALPTIWEGFGPFWAKAPEPLSFRNTVRLLLHRTDAEMKNEYLQGRASRRVELRFEAI